MDSWSAAAARILQWLDAIPQLPLPTAGAPPADDRADLADDKDDVDELTSGEWNFHSNQDPWPPVRRSDGAPTPNWNFISSTFGYFPPFHPAKLNISVHKASAFVSRPPPKDQLPVLRDTVANVLRSRPY